MSKNAKLVLEKALEVIADADHWTKDCEAIDADGQPVRIDSEYAEKFCSIGAIMKARWDLELLAFDQERAIEALGRFISGAHMASCVCNHCVNGWAHNWEDDIVGYNDDEEITHEDVVLTFKRCIHALEELDNL